MRRYFRRPTDDIGLGPGTVWLEFDGEWATRQVENYGERWLSSREEYHEGLGPGLVDQPLSVLELGPEYEVEDGEFERAWELSGRRAEPA